MTNTRSSATTVHSRLDVVHTLPVLLTVFFLCLPGLALAGAPFAAGATALQTNLITILTPVAVIGLIALGVAAWFGQARWGWAVAIILGIALVFGAQQILTWIRGLFGV